MGDMTKNFSQREFACKCGCGYDDITPQLVEACQTIRDDLGEAITINYGCRCEQYNKAVGGVTGSYHTKGLAADLHCKSGGLLLYLHIINLCDKGHLSQVQYVCWYQKQNFVHIDCGKVRNNRFAVR